jgi:hypothetical protein
MLSLQILNFKELIFVNKNWPNDPIIGCRYPSNLIEFLKKDIDLEREFKKI